MKNTSNVKRYYAMSLIDGRVVIATRELLTNPDYRVVSEQLARDVESGKRDWKKVAFELRQRDNMNQSELVRRAEQEKVKNVNPSPVTRENVEQFETKISEEEIGEIYDGADATDEASPENNGGKKPSRRSARNKTQSEEVGDESDGSEDLDI